MAAKRSHKARVETHPRTQIRCALHPGYPTRAGDGTRMAFTPSAFQWMGRHPHSPTPKKTETQGVQPEQDAGKRMVSSAPDEHGRGPDPTQFGALPHPIRTQSAVSANTPTLHPKSIALLGLVKKHNGLFADGRCGHHRCHFGCCQKCAPTNLGRAHWLCHLFGCSTMREMRPNRGSGTQESS